MKGFFKEFVAFLKQGNLLQIATGLLLATSFNALVTAFSNSFIMPIVTHFTGNLTDDNLKFSIGGITFPYGTFISAFITFVIIGIVLFIIIKAYNRFMIKEEENKANIENEVDILKDIRTLLTKEKDNQA